MSKKRLYCIVSFFRFFVRSILSNQSKIANFCEGRSDSKTGHRGAISAFCHPTVHWLAWDERGGGRRNIFFNFQLEKREMRTGLSCFMLPAATFSPPHQWPQPRCDLRISVALTSAWLVTSDSTVSFSHTFDLHLTSKLRFTRDLRLMSDLRPLDGPRLNEWPLPLDGPRLNEWPPLSRWISA